MLRSARSAPAPQGLRQIVWAAALGCALATPLAALAQGKVYVSSEKDNKIYVFDAKGERLSAIDTCERPRHMMFNANRSQIYVCCGDSNQLGLVDTATGKMTGTVPLGDSPEIFDLSPDGKTVATGSWGNTLVLWDVGTGQKKHSLSGQTRTVRSVAFSPDGKLLASGARRTASNSGTWPAARILGR